KPHRKTFIEQNRERQMLSHRPIDGSSPFNRLAPRFDNARDGLVHVDAGRNLGYARAQLDQLALGRSRGAATVVVFRPRKARPDAVEPIGLIRLEAFAALEFAIQELSELVAPELRF